MKKYDLVGVNGNAFSLMSYTADAMKKEGFPEEEIHSMYEEAMSSDYYNLIRVCDSYVNEANKKAQERGEK